MKTFRKALPFILLMAAMLCSLPAAAFALFEAPAAAESESDPAEKETKVRTDNLSVTHHTAAIQGQEIAYTATAGTIAMDTELGQYDIFFIAYIKDNVDDPATRPITFAWNGGPGCSALYVNLGLLGPDRIAVDENGMIIKVPTDMRSRRKLSPYVP